MSDCLWGLLDGMNDAGLAVSLTFGGRSVSGDGFAIPLVVRHLLEVCDSVDEACEVLARVPVHASQNLTMVDASGNFTTAYLGPDRPVQFARTPVSTNHQVSVEWPEYERAVRSLEREQWLLRLVGHLTRRSTDCRTHSSSRLSTASRIWLEPERCTTPPTTPPKAASSCAGRTSAGARASQLSRSSITPSTTPAAYPAGHALLKLSRRLVFFVRA